MNEAGELAPLLDMLSIERLVDVQACKACGASGFVPCWWCQGDKKACRMCAPAD